MFISCVCRYERLWSDKSDERAKPFIVYVTLASANCRTAGLLALPSNHTLLACGGPAIHQMWHSAGHLAKRTTQMTRGPLADIFKTDTFETIAKFKFQAFTVSRVTIAKWCADPHAWSSELCAKICHWDVQVHKRALKTRKNTHIFIYYHPDDVSKCLLFDTGIIKALKKSNIWTSIIIIILVFETSFRIFYKNRNMLATLNLTTHVV